MIQRYWLRISILINLAALAGLWLFVLAHAFPSSEAVRIRNAFLIEFDAPNDFAWTPATVPPTFRMERAAASPEFVAVVARTGVDQLKSDWDKALALADHLTRNARDKGPIQADLHTTYRKIVEEGYGYCADFTDVYLGLAHAAGLAARMWAFSFDGFGGHGHAFVEVFDRQQDRWAMLDVYNNFYAVDRASGEPLSALEFRDAVTGWRGPVDIRRIGPGRFPYIFEDKLFTYYRRGADQWFLWWGNDVFTYDRSFTVKAAGKLSPATGQLVALALDTYPHIRVLKSPENAAQFEQMADLKNRMIGAGILCCALFVGLMVQMLLYRWRKHHEH